MPKEDFMILNILSILAIVIIGLLIYAGFKTPEMDIERKISIKASPEKLFPFINNSRTMNDWMPWQDADPTGVLNYSGPTEGVGSRATWNSKGKMGAGESEIVESIQNQIVKTKLTYTKPMVMSQLAYVSLNPQSNGETLVTWSVNCHNTFVFRVFGIFVNVDKMVGGEFEKGLAKLKNMAE
jgi:acyl-CoA thioesterase FadM